MLDKLLDSDFGRSLTAVTILHTCPNKLTSKSLIHYIYACLVIFVVNILLGWTTLFLNTGTVDLSE